MIHYNRHNVKSNLMHEFNYLLILFRILLSTYCPSTGPSLLLSLSLLILALKLVAHGSHDLQLFGIAGELLRTQPLSFTR